MILRIERKLTPREIAEVFAELDDEQQAQVFIELALIARDWGTGGGIEQWHSVGRHLRDCSCSSDEARAIVREMADGALTETETKETKT